MEGYAEGGRRHRSMPRVALGIAFNGVISPSHPAQPGTRGWTYAEGVSVSRVTVGTASPMPTASLCRGPRWPAFPGECYADGLWPSG